MPTEPRTLWVRREGANKHPFNRLTICFGSCGQQGCLLSPGHRGFFGKWQTIICSTRCCLLPTKSVICLVGLDLSWLSLFSRPSRMWEIYRASSLLWEEGGRVPGSTGSRFSPPSPQALLHIYTSIQQLRLVNIL